MEGISKFRSIGDAAQPRRQLAKRLPVSVIRSPTRLGLNRPAIEITGVASALKIELAPNQLGQFVMPAKGFD